MLKFVKDQIFLCNLTFKAQVISVYPDDKLIEIKNLSNNQKYLFTFKKFEEMIQTKH